MARVVRAGMGDGLGTTAPRRSCVRVVVSTVPKATVGTLPVGSLFGLGGQCPMRRVFPRIGAPHCHANGPYAGVAHVRHDVCVGLAHRLGQRAPDLSDQHLADFRPIRNGLDRADHGLADNLGSQRVAAMIGRAQLQQRPHVGIQFADFPFTGVRDFQRKPVRADVVLDLVVIDQGQGFPTRHQ